MLVSIIGRNHRIKNEESGQRHFIKTETYIKNNFNLLLKGRQLSRLLLNNLVADRNRFPLVWIRPISDENGMNWSLIPGPEIQQLPKLVGP